MKKSMSLSLKDAGLRNKLFVSFGLMSIIPLLAIVYMFNKYLPLYDNFRSLSIVFGISLLIAFTGFVIIKQIIDPVIRMAGQAKQILRGKYDSNINVEREDEIGQLGLSLNQLTRRIRDNMDELRDYGEKTKNINLEINRKVIVLSSLLQVGNLISQGNRSKEVLEVLVEKAAQIGDSQAGFIFLVNKDNKELMLEAAFGFNSKEAKQARFEITEGVFANILENNRSIISDSKKHIEERDSKFLEGILGFRNYFLYPVFGQGSPVGILGIANNQENFSFRDDDKELMELFGRQVSIIRINDMLIQEAERLEIRDSLTGLYNERYIKSRLDEEIKRAIVYQRPCSFILVSVDSFGKFHSSFGELATELALKKIAVIIENSIGEIDKAARFSDQQFALVLPEKNKKEALEIAAQLKKKIDFAFSEESDLNKRLTVTVKVSENPIDGVSAGELIKAVN